MSTFHTVYDFANQSLRLTFLIPLPIIAIGCYTFYYYKNLKIDHGRLFFQLKSRRVGMLYSLITILFCGSWALFVGISDLKNYNHASDIYYQKKYSTVKGRVENYHPMPQNGGDTERFEVSGVRFEYMDYDQSDYGYNNAASHGGAIRPNLFVRITYYNNGAKNIILKLDAE